MRIRKFKVGDYVEVREEDGAYCGVVVGEQGVVVGNETQAMLQLLFPTHESFDGSKGHYYVQAKHLKLVCRF